jgi:hypothetical protein
MPLLDHFRPPLVPYRHWHSFHNGWAARIAADLNQRLPKGWFAEPNVLFGIEVDVATFEDTRHSDSEGGAPPPPSTDGWVPPAPVFSTPFEPTTETVEISIFNSEAGLTLTGAIELVSPGNKDRPASREAFVSKCQTYLRQGVGLVVVDAVTTHHAQLHQELLARLAAPHPAFGEPLYAAAYRLVEREGHHGLDVWQEALALGAALPTMPLWLRPGLCLPVNLNATYEQTCLEQRITPDLFDPPVRLAG